MTLVSVTSRPVHVYYTLVSAQGHFSIFADEGVPVAELGQFPLTEHTTAKAKELLAEAGYTLVSHWDITPDGFRADVVRTPV